MSGEIYLNGKDYKYNDIKIGYVSQKISLLNSSIIKILHLVNQRV